MLVLQENYGYLKEKLGEVCAKHGERVLETGHNPISIGCTKSSIYFTLENTCNICSMIAGVTLSSAGKSRADVTEFGSMLFLKSVSGTR